MQRLALENQGKCLSKKYMNCKTKMIWTCKNGHRFQTTADNIKHGRWCPHCRTTDP
jgi:hypothetical protein